MVSITQLGNFKRAVVAYDDTETILQLIKQGYYHVDRTLDVVVHLKKGLISLPRRRYEVQSVPFDASLVKKISYEAFTKDRRFHLTMKYNNEYARQWIDQYIDESVCHQDTLLVCFYKTQPIGFGVLRECADRVLSMHLAAVLPKYQGAGAAIELYYSALEYCRNNDASVLKGRISSANTAVMNLYILLGGNFTNPLDVYMLEDIKNDT
jgi:ribosomal protein S18 acetylase RimI-like enzyme